MPSTRRAKSSAAMAEQMLKLRAYLQQDYHNCVSMFPLSQDTDACEMKRTRPPHDVLLDPSVHLYLSEEGALCILKPDHVPIRPSLMKTSWNQFERTLDPRDVISFSVKDVNLDLCEKEIIMFVRKCINIRKFVNHNSMSKPVQIYPYSNQDRQDLISEVIDVGRDKKLREIDICDNNLEGYCGHQIMEKLTKKNKFKSVTLKRTKLGYQSVHVLAVDKLDHLHWLDLTECGLCPSAFYDFMQKLSWMRDNKKLFGLIIDGNKMENKDRLPDFLTSFSKLQLFSAACCKLKDQVLANIAGSVSRDVEVLALQGNSAMSEPWASTLVSSLADLHKLSILRMSPGQLNIHEQETVTAVVQAKGGHLFTGKPGDIGWELYKAAVSNVRHHKKTKKQKT